MKRRSTSLIIMIMCTLMLVACAGESVEDANEGADSAQVEETRQLVDEPFVREEFLLGTLVTLTVYDEGGEEALDKAFERVESLDNTFSMRYEGSEVYEINEKAGIEPVQVSDEVFHVIERAVQFAEESNGRFDPTIGALTGLWGIGETIASDDPELEGASVPTPEKIKEKVDLVDYHKITLDSAEKTVYLEEKGMKLDLGAIAKGYITDQAAASLKEQGVTTAIADLGGDIFLVGSSARGVDDPWKIGIQNPFANRGEIIGAYNTQDKAVVTSGIYERFIEEDGKQYHHILSPEDGYPIDNELAGLSVIANTAMEADALATVIFSMGLEEGLNYVDTLDDVVAIAITKDKKIYISDGKHPEFKVTDSDFELIERE